MCLKDIFNVNNRHTTRSNEGFAQCSAHYNTQLLVLEAAFLWPQFNGKQGGAGQKYWHTGPALPPQRSANGMPLHSTFSIKATGACALGRLAKGLFA